MSILELLVYAAIAVFYALVVASIVLPIVLLRGGWRWATTGLVTCLWAGWWWNHGGRQSVDHNWAAGALKVCEAEFKALPDEVVAAGLLDSSHVLDFANVVWLLAERRIPFVEVPTAGSNLSADRATQPHEPVSEWRPSTTAGPIARLSLGASRSANCAARTPPPDFEAGPREVLAISCVLVEYASQPMAPIELALDPAKPRETYGSWQLRDRVSHRDIARLTTGDSTMRTVLGRLGRANDLGCRFPQAPLLRRLVGPKPGDGPSR